MSVAIVANGPIQDQKKISSRLRAFDRIIAVDGGLIHLQKMGFTPALIVGDFDSCSKELLQKYSHIERISLKRDKDQTDLEIALEHTKPEQNVRVFGGVGGRLDHTLAHLLLLLRYKNLCFETEKELLFVVHQTVSLEVNKGQTLSLLPLFGRAEGITTRNLKWELHNASMDQNYFGISNVCLKNEVEISAATDNLLCILND